MRRGRGFIYTSSEKSRDQAGSTSSGTASTAGAGRGGRSGQQQQQQSTSSHGRSPLKRKRSPEPLPLSSAGASKRSGNRGGLSSKIAKPNDPFEEDTDELDDLGAAALEQYELTQRDPGQNRSPTPGSDPIPISHSAAPASTSSSVALDWQPRVGGTSQLQSRGGWPNPYRETKSSIQQPTVISESSASSESSEDYRDQIKQLQEQNYTKDGEVKVLRGEKERLVGELRKKDEQLQNVQSKLLSEKQTIQEQLMKEKDTLATKLQFRDQELQVKEQQLLMKEQELAKLRERLGQQKSGESVSSAPLSSSAMCTPKMMPSVSSAHRSGSRPSEFLSTENFMPLSQMTTGDVTPVQVGQKRMKEEESKPPKKATRRSSKSPSISPGSHGGGTGGTSSKLPSSSNVKKPGESSKRDTTTKHRSTSTHESGGLKPTSQQAKRRGSHDERASSKSSMGSSDPEFFLNAPSSMEPTTAQLLMLLVQRDLLKIPFSEQRLDVKQLSVMCPGEEESACSFFDDETENTCSSSSLSAESQAKPTATATASSSAQDQKKLTGLLSLLHLEPARNRPGVNLMPQFSSGDSSASQSSAESSLSESMMTSQIPPPLSLAPPGPSGSSSMDVVGPSSSPSDLNGTITTTTTVTTTPVRSRSKLHLSKPHTLARTDLTRARTQHHQPSDLVKSHSASNSPYPRKVVLEDHNPASLASSIDKDSLKQSIAAMLRSADVSMDASSLQFGGSEARSFSSISASCNQLGLGVRGSSSDTSVVSLLKQLGNIVCQYYDEQLNKAQASSNSNTSGFVTDMGSESLLLDASSVSSPKSSIGASSSVSSKTSSDLTCPLEGDQQLASQALDLLETLTTYSKTAREHILMQPPEFNIDSSSRPSSALDVHAESSGDYLSQSSEEKFKSTANFSPTTLNLMKVSGRLGALQHEAMADSSSPREEPKPSQKVFATYSWKGTPLCQLKDLRKDIGVSGKVWVKRKNTDTTDFSSTAGSSSSHVTPLPIPPRSRGTSCGQLFQILLELPVPQWRESLENVNTSLRILTALAEDCPEETLQRFSSLFHDDKLGHCLDKDDPQLTLTTLQLLYQLVRSPSIAELICLHNNVACLPLICYQSLLEPTPNANDKDIIFKIRLQIVRLVSRILMLSNGVKVVFEKCGCSHELLKSLTSLLNKLIEVPKSYYKLSQFSQHELLLIKEIVSLMYLISVYDPFFDTHLKQCEYWYVFVLNRLSFLFSTAKGEELDEAALVVELLEYCDEYEEESQEDGGGSDTEMEMEEEAATSTMAEKRQKYDGALLGN